MGGLEVLQHPGAHLGITRMKAPPHRTSLLRLSKQLGDTAWQKSVPPLSLWGVGLGGDGFVLLCDAIAPSRVFVNNSVFTYVHSAPNLAYTHMNFHNA